MLKSHGNDMRERKKAEMNLTCVPSEKFLRMNP